MFPNALQLEGIKFHMMDNATYLSFMHMIDNHGQANATMQTKMGQFWTDFHLAYTYYDQVINPARKSLQTEELVDLDTARDNSLGAYHEALLGLQRNPNSEKRQAARLLLLNYDTFAPDRGQEYMKETELVDQMLKDIADSAEMTAAVTLLGLDDYVADLAAKNEAFAVVMASRTASTEGASKGVVAAARTQLEEKYQLFRRMLNVASIYEGDTDYRSFILSANAEVAHYKDVLARKGVSTGSSSNSSNSSNSGTTPSGGTEEGGQQGGSSSEEGTGSEQGGTTPTPDPDAGFGGGGDQGGTTPQPDDDAGFGG